MATTAAAMASAGGPSVAKATQGAPANASLAPTKAPATTMATATTTTNTSSPSDPRQQTNADASGSADAAPEPLAMTIRVPAAANIRGSKGEHVNSFVRVQFADFDFKDSAPVADSGAPEFGLVFDQSFLVDEALVEVFANKSLTVTLIEALPKDKTAVLGTAEVSLFRPFLKYFSRDPASAAAAAAASTASASADPAQDAPIPPSPLVFRETVPISYINTKLLTPNAEAQKSLPECTIEVILSRPLLKPDEIQNGNFVTLRIDDLWPVPEEWSTKEGNERDLNSNIFSYSLTFTLPRESGGERTVTIPNGSLIECKVPVASDPCANIPQAITFADLRKEQSSGEPNATTAAATTTVPAVGSTSGSTAANATNTATAATTSNASGANAPNAANNAAGATGANAAAAPAGAPTGGPAPAQTNNDDNEQAKVETEEIKKVTWGTNYIIYIGPLSLERIRKLAQEKCNLEIEFSRTPQPKFASVVDTAASKYRGRAVIDLAMMMYPNVIGIKGRFPLDVIESGEPNSNAANESAGHKSKKDPNNIYRNINATVGLEMMLSMPFIDKKKLQAITKSVGDFIPKRYVPPNLLFEKRSKQAEDDFKTKIGDIVNKLAHEYKSALQIHAEARNEDAASGLTPPSSSVDDEQQRKKLFLYHLNKSGAYYSFKEQLKASVVQVVRERFLRKSPFASQAELQLFMSEVYVYLIDQMHVSINKIFSERGADIVDPTVNRSADFNALKAFAEASELDRQLRIAAKYHQERVAKYEESLSAWFDYACFAMRNDMFHKGEECLKEILSRNPKHVPALLVYGAVCCAQERFEESRVYLTTAVQLEPKYALANTFLAMFYETMGEDIESEKYYSEAKTLHESEMPADGMSHFMVAAEFATRAHVCDFADRALAQELLLRGPSVPPYLILSQLEIQRANFTKAAEHLKEAVEMESNNVAVWAALGHLQFIQGKLSEAKQSYETVRSLNQGQHGIGLIYLRLGSIYLHSACGPLNATQFTPISPSMFIKGSESVFDTSFALIAKNMFLKACTIAPSSQSWLGAGKACLALKEYQQAEDAFAEANVLNNRDSEVWAYLALLSLTLSRVVEANQAIAQALRLGIKDADVIKAVGTAFLQKNETMAAIECLRMALEESPDDQEAQALFARALEQNGRVFLSGGKGEHGSQVVRSDAITSAGGMGARVSLAI